MDFEYLLGFLPDAIQGLLVTIGASAVGVGIGILLGVLLGGLRASRMPGIGGAVAVYVEGIRNTPFLAQLFFIYFGLPAVGLVMPPYTSAVVALAMWTSAYSSENFRAGFDAVKEEFRQGAMALGLSRLDAFRFVTLPVSLRIALPSLGNTIIEATKNSAFLGLISVPEFTGVVVSEIVSSFKVLEGFVLLGSGYLLLILLLTRLLSALENRLDIARTT